MSDMPDMPDMPDMADFALERAEEEVMHFQRFENAPLHVQYDDGLIDEYGDVICNPGSIPAAVFTKATNTDRCRDCGSVTVNRTGPHGIFTGCSTYPKCRWSESR